MNDLNGILSLIDGEAHFVLTSHESPDADGIGSCVALAGLLDELGKSSRIIVPDQPPSRYGFLDPDKRLEVANEQMLNSVDWSSTVFMLLDAGEPKRTGALMSAFIPKAKVFGIIDHHVPELVPNSVRYVDTLAVSTGELVYQLIQAFGKPITMTMARGIYTSIIVDSGNFRFERTTARTHQIAAEMIRLGVDPTECYDQVHQSHPRSRIELLAKVLMTLEYMEDGLIASMSVTEDMLESVHASSDQTEEFVNLPFQAEVTKISAFFKESGDYVKVSLRSRGDYNVREVAARFGGGGHVRASGLRVKGSLNECKSQVIDAIREVCL